jgi:hypothetical protein
VNAELNVEQTTWELRQLTFGHLRSISYRGNQISEVSDTLSAVSIDPSVAKGHVATGELSDSPSSVRLVNCNSILFRFIMSGYDWGVDDDDQLGGVGRPF